MKKFEELLKEISKITPTAQEIKENAPVGVDGYVCLVGGGVCYFESRPSLLFLNGKFYRLKFEEIEAMGRVVFFDELKTRAIYELRSKFEETEFFKKTAPKNDDAFSFNKPSNMYFDYGRGRDLQGYINGAWCMFQELNK